MLRIWAAPLNPWAPPWLSCSPVLHKETNTTQVCADSRTRLHPLVCRSSPSHLCSVSLCVGIAARETAQALKTLAQAARGVAASTSDPRAAAGMLDSARDVMEGSALLIHEAKEALVSPGDAESQQRLAQVRRSGPLRELRGEWFCPVLISLSGVGRHQMSLLSKQRCLFYYCSL